MTLSRRACVISTAKPSGVGAPLHHRRGRRTGRLSRSRRLRRPRPRPASRAGRRQAPGCARPGGASRRAPGSGCCRHAAVLARAQAVLEGVLHQRLQRQRRQQRSPGLSGDASMRVWPACRPGAAARWRGSAPTRPNSSSSRMRSRPARSSVWRKNCARSMAMARAPAGSRWVRALMEFRLLNRKCGSICRRNSCNSMSRASSRACASRAAWRPAWPGRRCSRSCASTASVSRPAKHGRRVSMTMPRWRQPHPALRRGRTGVPAAVPGHLPARAKAAASVATRRGPVAQCDRPRSAPPKGRLRQG